MVSHETEQMINIVHEIRRAGVALIVVEHVEAVIRELAQRVIVLDRGKVVARGTPEEVAADPRVREIYLGEGNTAVRGPRASHRPTAEPPLLELVDVTAGYGKAVAPGRRQPEGARRRGGLRARREQRGKTTMTRAITGLLPVSSGEVVLRNGPRCMPARRLLGVACCPEGRRIFRELTVNENLMLGGFTLDGAARTRAKELTALFPVLGGRRWRHGHAERWPAAIARDGAGR